MVVATSNKCHNGSQSSRDKSQMSKRILILDDEMDNNITIEAVLQDNGFKVDSYEDPIISSGELQESLL